MGVKVVILFFVSTKYCFLVIISVFPALYLLFSKQQDSKLTKLKYPKENKKEIGSKCVICLGKVRNKVGKGESAYDQQFLLFQ